MRGKRFYLRLALRASARGAVVAVVVAVVLILGAGITPRGLVTVVAVWLGIAAITAVFASLAALVMLLVFHIVKPAAFALSAGFGVLVGWNAFGFFSRVSGWFAITLFLGVMTGVVAALIVSNVFHRALADPKSLPADES